MSLGISNKLFCNLSVIHFKDNSLRGGPLLSMSPGAIAQSPLEVHPHAGMTLEFSPRRSVGPTGS